METRFADIEERITFAQHLVDRFGSTASASQCIEEMLKVCPKGFQTDILKNIRMNINAGTYKKIETWEKVKTY